MKLLFLPSLSSFLPSLPSFPLFLPSLSSLPPFPFFSSQVWNIHTYAVVHEFPEQNHWVRALVVHGKSLFSGSYKTVKVREDIAEGVRGEGLLPWSGGCGAFSFWSFQIWSLDSYECLREMHCSGGSVYSMTLTNKYLVCGTYENCISVSLS